MGSPPIEQGLRAIGSGVPILVAASYLLLAILTLIAGATGDTMGRKRLLLIGLASVLLAELASMFWLGTSGFFYANLLLNVAQIIITPMCIALAAFTFAPGVRPFAYGVIFSTQAVALGLSSVWASAVFLGVYGLVAFAGGYTSRNALLTIAIGLAGLVLVYRNYYRRLRKRGELKHYNVRGLAFAILAAMTAAMVQAVLFYQFWTYFVDVRGLGAVAATLQFAPFLIGMLVGTTLIVRLATRFGARRLITGRLILMAVGLLALSRLAVDTPLSYLILPIALLGLGLGIAGPARTSVILSAPPPRLIGSGAGINAAAGQSDYTLGVIVSSLLVTTLADSAFHAQMRQANLSPATMAKIDSVWENTFARAMSGNYIRLPTEALDELVADRGNGRTLALETVW